MVRFLNEKLYPQRISASTGRVERLSVVNKYNFGDLKRRDRRVPSYGAYIGPKYVTYATTR